MINPELDGIEHINMYSQGKTEFGRMLSNWHRYSLDTEDGEFESLEGYHYWLGLPDTQEREELRHLYGFKAKEKGRELKKNFGEVFREEYKIKMSKALITKIAYNQSLFKEIYYNLPILHYYNYKGKVVDRTEESRWLIAVIETCLEVIKDERNKNLNENRE